MNSEPVTKPGIGHFEHVYTKHIALPTLATWHSLHATPNMLTTLGVITSTASVYYYSVNERAKAIAALLLRQYFDFADGLLAREYNQTSSIGDYYDHFNDVIWFIGMFAVTMKVYPPEQQTKIIFALFLAVVVILTHASCREKISTYRENSASLDILAPLQAACDIGHESLQVFDSTVIYFVFVLLILNRPA